MSGLFPHQYASVCPLVERMPHPSGSHEQALTSAWSVNEQQNKRCLEGTLSPLLSFSLALSISSLSVLLSLSR